MMNTRSRIGGAVLAATLTVGTTAVEAQQTTLTGQVRPRIESRDPSAGGGSDTFTSMRVRLGLQAELESNFTIFIQAQDVRIWGEETSPLFDFQADNLDMHQAYFRYTASEVEGLTATVGRMETALGGQRLVGVVDWAQQGQSFDGARVDLSGDAGTVAVLAYTVGDMTAATSNENRQLYGAYATRPDVGSGDLDVYWLYDRARSVTETNEHLLGARYVYDGELQGRFEATLQRGTRNDADVAAFMVGARVGTSINEGRGTVTLWYDYLSGDDPTTPEVEVFNTLYATGHKFYGFADLFTNIPVHTGGAGLQDIAAKLTLMPSDDTTLGADLHRFLAAEQGGLSGTHFGDEIDLWARHTYTPNFAVQAGLSFVSQDDALAEVGRLGENQVWFYVMFDAAF